MARYAVLVDGVVDNMIEWDGNTEIWSPEHGTDVVAIEEDQVVDIGYSYAGGSFSPPA